MMDNLVFSPELPKSFRDGYRGKIRVGRRSISVWTGMTTKPHSWLHRRLPEVMTALQFSDGERHTRITNIVISERWDNSGVSVSVSGDVVKTATGRKCGDWERVFYFTMRGVPQYVYNSSFGLNRSQQGKGFARGWLASCFRAYEAMGFREVTVTAAGTNGRYTWAALGFDRKNKNSVVNIGGSWIGDAIRAKVAAAELELSPETVASAMKLVKGEIPKGMTMQEVANLGRNDKWRDRRGQHLGRVILMDAPGWSGQYDLRKNKSLQTAA